MTANRLVHCLHDRLLLLEQVKVETGGKWLMRKFKDRWGNFGIRNIMLCNQIIVRVFRIIDIG